MDALESLKEYGSDASSDEEPSPKVSELKLPELPSSILSMFKDEIEDDSRSNGELHKGRQRSFPHVPGNWATFVYCKVSVSDAMTRLMADLLDCFNTEDEGEEVKVELMEDVHVSLSKTVTLQYHCIEPLTADLMQGLTATIPQFDFSFDGIKILTNDEKSRSFLALTVGVGSSQLQSAVDVVDKCLGEYSLESFYKDACFHASFAWFLGDASDIMTTDLGGRLEKCFYRHQSSFPQRVDQIWCKSGCKQFSFQLRK
ncbi:U6 snRNA phosphodiesterase 1-like [Apostichopus japonicus]|uniref:U6 snRNA phosphodiesterase 1-like n=1 Tax=Stichopus japonicus TaxID=307972 RepID=UPI003AB6CAD5